MISVYCEIRMEQLNKLLRQNIIFYIKLSGTYNYHCDSSQHFPTERICYIVICPECTQVIWLIISVILRSRALLREVHHFFSPSESAQVLMEARHIRITVNTRPASFPKI